MIVWLASYQRSGNTFFRSLLHSLYNQETYSIYNDPELEQMNMAPILGQRRLPGTLDEMRQENRVYFVKTHDLPSDESPTIYLVRDGRDACVSWAHFQADYKLQIGISAQAASKLLGHSRFEQTLEGVVREGQWQSHVLAWTERPKGGPTFVVHYEDLIADPVRWSQSALAGVGTSLEPNGGAPLTFDALHAQWPQYFRRGRVGSWREEMPERIHEMFWRRGRVAMQRFGYVNDMPAALQPALPSQNCSPLTIRSSGADEVAPPSVSMTGLGHASDWGTTLFQYMFLKSFARRHRMIAEVPPWLGKSLFQERDEPVRKEHEVVVCDNLTLSREPSDPIGNQPVFATRVGDLTMSGKTVYLLNDPVLSDVEMQLPFRHADLDGPFVLHSRMLAQHRDYLRNLLRPAPAHEAALHETLQRLRARGKTIVGVHCLTKDGRLEIGGWNSCSIPLRWYVKVLTKIWQRVEDPVLLLCTDDEPQALLAFAQFNPVTMRTLRAETPVTSEPLSPALPGRHSLTFIEWLLLGKCDVLAIANDLSSFTAAMMNCLGLEFWRPSSRRFGVVAFEPWDAEPIMALARRATLAGELAQRIRLIRASDGRRSRFAQLAHALQLYASILRGRASACYQFQGGSGLLRELIGPQFYLAARRGYGNSERISRGD